MGQECWCGFSGCLCLKVFYKPAFKVSAAAAVTSRRDWGWISFRASVRIQFLMGCWTETLFSLCSCPKAALSFLPHELLCKLVYNMTAEFPQNQPCWEWEWTKYRSVFSNQISEVAAHHVCHILVIGLNHEVQSTITRRTSYKGIE